MTEGPFGMIDLDLDRETGEKVQLGTSGISMPGRRKAPLNVIFALDSHVATLPKMLKGDTKTNRKIKDKFKGTPSVRAARSGNVSAFPAENQGVIVRLGGDSLPVQLPEVERAKESIERSLSIEGSQVNVSGIIMDTE